jgi:hypothetical protein
VRSNTVPLGEPFSYCFPVNHTHHCQSYPPLSIIPTTVNHTHHCQSYPPLSIIPTTVNHTHHCQSYPPLSIIPTTVNRTHHCAGCRPVSSNTRQSETDRWQAKCCSHTRLTASSWLMVTTSSQCHQ